jgi:hypothetical protein
LYNKIDSIINKDKISHIRPLKIFPSENWKRLYKHTGRIKV